MIKTTYICDHCYKETEKEKTDIARIIIQKFNKTVFLDKTLELCPICSSILAKEIMNFIQPPRKDV